METIYFSQSALPQVAQKLFGQTTHIITACFIPPFGTQDAHALIQVTFGAELSEGVLTNKGTQVMQEVSTVGLVVRALNNSMHNIFTIATTTWAGGILLTVRH